mgnify:CR=1 FL=1
MKTEKVENLEKTDRKVRYAEIEKFKAYKIFESYGLGILTETISNFFSCSVHVIAQPEKVFSTNYNINIRENIGLTPYSLDCFN